MTITGTPERLTTAKELQRLARRMERDAILRRKLLKRVGELEHSIREARRLFTQLVASIDVGGDLPPDDAAPEVAS